MNDTIHLKLPVNAWDGSSEARIVKIGENMVRPQATTVWIIDAPSNGVIIPWPIRVSLKEAIIAWSKQQPEYIERENSI